MSRTRRVLKAAGIAVSVIIGLAVLVLVVSQTPWFKDWLRGYIVRQANEYLHPELAIGSLGGNLLTGVELENVSLTENGETIISIKDVGLAYNPLDFVSGGVALHHIRINQPHVLMRRTADGWNLGQIVKVEAREADREGPGRPIRLDEITITGGTVVIDDRTAAADDPVRLPRRVEQLDVKAAFEYEPVRFTIDVGQITLRTREPSLDLNSFSGRIGVRDDDIFVEDLAIRTAESSLLVRGAVEDYLETPLMNLTISSDKLTLQEVAGFVPALQNVRLQPAFEIRTNGPMRALTVSLNVRSEAGSVRGDLLADVESERRAVSGTLAVEHLNVGRITGDPALESDVTATTKLDVTATGADDVRGTVQLRADEPVTAAGYRVERLRADATLDGPRTDIDASVAAYGATATATGRVVRPTGPAGQIAYDLRGRVADMDVRSLPPQIDAPRLATDVTARYHVRGEGQRIEADAVLGRSTVEGTVIEEGTTASLSMDGQRLRYSARGGIAGLDPQRLGRALDVPALADPRFSGRVTGTFDVEGSGRTIEELVARAGLDLRDSSILGGRLPVAAVSARVERGTLDATVRGRFENMDPGLIAGRPELAGSVGGGVDVEIGVRELGAPITPEVVRASGRIDLAPSRFGELQLNTVAVQGAYADGLGRVEELRVDGPALEIDASGEIAADRAHQSDLTYRIELKDLQTLGAVAGVEELAGTALVEGRVTGNAAELRTDGTFKGSMLQYGDTARVTSATTEYLVALPELDAERLRAETTTRAALVRVAGRDVLEAEAQLQYAERALDFEATVYEEEHQAEAGGRLLFPEEGGQDVVVTRLGLGTERIRWTTPAGEQAHVTIRENLITIDDIELVSGAQRIAASGTIALAPEKGPPPPGDAELRVQLERVDLAEIDALTGGDWHVAGELNADLTLRGTTREPVALGEVSIVRGAFREFQYEQLAGTVDYTPRRAAIDFRLDQAPGTWLTAQGTIPLAELQADGAARPVETLDLRIESSPIPLSVVQGAVPALTRVQGTLLVDVHATGTTADPRFDGEVAIQDGAFTIEPLETRYQQLNARVRMLGDRIDIEGFRLLDEGGNPLEMAGGITLREKQVGVMDIQVNTRRFSLLDNRLGDLVVTADMRIVGEPLRPRVTGEVAVQQGRLEVDRLLEQLQAGWYATEATGGPGLQPIPAAGEVVSEQAAEAAGAAPDAAGQDEPTAFENLALDLRLRVPDNLVLRGDDLRVGGRGLNLGDVNVTIGGDLEVTKAAGEDLRVAGTVRTVRGFYEFQGRRFEVDRESRISWRGPDPTDPVLDITARRQISGVEARVRIRGTAQRPELALSSTPPLDEADVLSLIVFNRPINDLGQGERVSLAERAGGLAAGFVAAPVAEALRGALDVDLLEIEAAGNGGPTLTIGDQIGERVFVRFRRQFGAQEVNEFLLEYQLADFLRLQTSIAEGGTSRIIGQRVERGGIDLIFFLAY
jgi:hypothetical protein